MRILVTETDRHRSNAVGAQLEHDGHTVVRCRDQNDRAFPCRELVEPGTCPVEDGVDMVVTVRSHPYPRPTAREDGVVCALRRHIPLVVAGTDALNPFGPWTAGTAGPDVVAACEAAAAAPLEQHSAIATTELRRQVNDASASAVVHRRDGRIVVTLALPDAVDATAAHRVGVRVAGAVRAFDPYAAKLDVSQTRAASGGSTT